MSVPMLSSQQEGTVGELLLLQLKSTCRLRRAQLSSRKVQLNEKDEGNSAGEAETDTAEQLQRADH